MEDKWSQRRLRHLSHQYGLKTELAINKLLQTARPATPPASVLCCNDGEASISNVNAIPHTDMDGFTLVRSFSLDRPFKNDIIEHRESVFRMACNGLSSLINGDLFHRHASSDNRRKRSKTPSYISVRERNKNFVGTSSFPTHRNIRKDLYLDTIYNNATPGTETALTAKSLPSNKSNFYIPQQLTSNFQTEAELDDEAIYDILFFDEGQLSKTSKETNNLRNVLNVHRMGPITIEQPRKKSLLQRFSSLFGSRREESTSKFRSLVKFNFSTKKSVHQQSRTMPLYGRFSRQLKDESCDYRPYFTYWISTVHILVTFIMLITYGIGTDYSNGLNVIERSGDVMTSSLSSVHLVVWEQNNVWMGPRFADLVHIGAKFTPCMRRDNMIYKQIIEERRVESENTGCCIGVEGCFQTSECPKQFATLVKWINGTFPEGNYSRAVCGQDSRYCLKPRSVHPFLWGLDISNWPTCEERSPIIPNHIKHMNCEVTGHPCCIQMHGQCRITSREYCDFVRGYYHPNATLCSQISCLNEVCGMTPFLFKEFPDQLYRFITPLFIHAGIIRCVISLTIYLTIMRRFEIMIGWLRLSSIYFVSGIGGYVASAVFVPYMPEVGPAGSEGGVLGALIVNIFYNWDLLSRPLRVLLFHITLAAILFLTGFFPYIDNWAQLFGFIFGSLMATVVIPYITFGKNVKDEWNKRLVIVIGSSAIMTLLYVFLFVLFFFYPVNYEIFGLFNCPFSGKICDHHGLILRNWLPI